MKKAANENPDCVDEVPCFSGGRVLVVEDNEAHQQVAVELLESAGLNVVVAENGKQALEWLEKETFSLVLMDIQMPVMDGYEAVRHLRSDDRFRDLSVLAMTAHVMAENRQKALDAGMNGYISKPILPGELYKNLMQWVSLNITERQSSDSPFESIAGLDMTSGLEYTGTLEIYRMTLNNFIKQYTGFSERVEKALESGDRKTALRDAHTLTSLAGVIGHADLHSAAASLEKALYLQEPVEQAMQDVQELLEPLLPKITKALEDE